MHFAAVTWQLAASGLSLQVDNDKNDNFLSSAKILTITKCSATIESNNPNLQPELKHNLVFKGSSLTLKNLIIGKDTNVSLVAKEVHLDNVVVNGNLHAEGDVSFKDVQQYKIGYINVVGSFSLENEKGKKLHHLSLHQTNPVNFRSETRVDEFDFKGTEAKSETTKMQNIALGNRNQIIPQKNCALLSGSTEHCTPFYFDPNDITKINHAENYAKEKGIKDVYDKMSLEELEKMQELINSLPTEGKSNQLTAEAKKMHVELIRSVIEARNATPQS